MANIYGPQNWSSIQALAGGDYFQTTSYGGPDAPIPGYPELASGEAVKMEVGTGPGGSNVITFDPSTNGEMWAFAGIALLKLGPLPTGEFETAGGIRVTWRQKLATAAIGEDGGFNILYPLVLVNRSNSGADAGLFQGDIWLQVLCNGDPFTGSVGGGNNFRWELDYQGSSGFVSDQLFGVDAADDLFHDFQVDLKPGTRSGASVASDGYITFKKDGVVIADIQGIDLVPNPYTNTTLGYGLWHGYHGLPGPVTSTKIETLTAVVKGQCCQDDPRTLLIWGGNDGAPLSAYFTDIDPAISIQAGEGLNGGAAIHGPHSGATVTDPTLTFSATSHLDLCGNVRQEFAIGASENFINPDWSGGFFAVRDSAVTGDLVSVRRDGNDLVVWDRLGDEVVRVKNCISTGTYRRYEVRGAIGTAGKSDGEICVQINKRPFGNGEDFSTVDPGSHPACPCTTGLNFLDAVDTAFTGWDQVVFGMGGDMTCVYVKEISAFCNDNPQSSSGILGRKDCPAPGPAGSSFDGSPKGPRAVQPGGFIATYGAPSGGGVPSMGTDPTDAQSLTDAEIVWQSFDLTLCDTSVHSYGQVSVPASGRALVRARVLRFGQVSYPLSDRFGSIRSQVWTVQLMDDDGEIRGFLSDATNRFFKRWQGQLFGESDIARLAGTARRSEARGRCVSAKVEQDLTITLTFADELSRQDSPFSLEQSLPRVTIGDVFQGSLTTATGIQFLAQTTPADPNALPFDNPPESIRGTATPILYGQASDQWRLLVNDVPAGICKAYLLGDVALKNGSETWQAYLCCLYGIKQVGTRDADGNLTGIFGSNLGSDCQASVQLDTDVLMGSGQLLIPGEGSWSDYFANNYIDVTVNGVTYRTTMFFARGPVSQQHVAGKVPFSFNCSGIETVGDCTGDTIDDLAYIAYHALDRVIFGQVLTGTWGTATAFSDGVPKVNGASFTAVKAVHDARVSGGYKGYLIIDTNRPAKDWLGDLFVSADIRLCPANHHGAATATTVDDTADLTTLTRFTDQRHVRDGSFQITSEFGAELETSATYDFGPEPATGRLAGPPQPATAQSAPDWGDTFKAADVHLVAISSPTIATDVIGRHLTATQDGINRGQYDIDLAGTDLEPGQLHRLTDFRGLGATGWTDRVLLASNLTLNPNVSYPPQASDQVVTVEWEDMQRQLVAEGTTDVSAVVASVGSESDSSAPLAGSESDGTAFRVG